MTAWGNGSWRTRIPYGERGRRYFERQRIGILVVYILMIGLGGTSCAPTSFNKIMLADSEARAGNYDRAEALWLEVAAGSDYHALEARCHLIELYDKEDSILSRLGHYGKKANVEKELAWRIREAEHPMYQKHNQYDGEYATLRGKKEWRIADMFRDGIGTPKDIDQACLWYERAYKAGGHGVATQLADHCASTTTVKAARDPVAVEWMRKYKIQCDGGRRTNLPPNFDPRSFKPCTDGVTVSLDEFRRSRSGQGGTGSVAGPPTDPPARIGEMGEGAASGTPKTTPQVGNRRSEGTGVASSGAPSSFEEGIAVCDAKFAQYSREWCACGEKLPTFSSLQCFCLDNPSLPVCQRRDPCPPGNADPLCQNNIRNDRTSPPSEPKPQCSRGLCGAK